MSEIFVYIIVLIIYMVLLLAIGFITGKRLKSVEDFYIGERKIGPWVTALSFIAAYFSSVVIVGGGGFGYKFGMSTLWVGAINVLLGCTLCWIVLGKRIREFTTKLRTMTIPGFLGERYNANEARIFSSIVISIFMIVYNVSILKGMGHIFEVLMDIPYFWGVILSGAVIIFYVSIGGYLAVVWTSFFQAWVMIFGLLLLTFATLSKVGGYTLANIKLAEMDPGLVSTPGVWGWAGLASFALIVSFGVWGMPQLIVRFYSIKSTDVLRIGTVVVTLGGCMALLPYFNGAISRVLFPSLENPDLAIPTLTKYVLPPVGAAILLAAVIAAGMSTFASVLIIVSSSIVRDFYQKGLKKTIDEKRVFLHSRIWSIIVGIVSLLIAFKPPSLVLVLCAFAWAVIASSCLWPILFGIYWKGATRAGCTASMLGGCGMALLWMGLGKPFGIHGFIPGIITGFILMILVSKLTPKLPTDHIKKIWG